ncbi:hypothetical protein M501DRAFT_928681 [Patellaria atrata CBS 101060]|uniref:Spindle pole body component n=1 Tax=Patellaria atrata CBS 101060 TaxID=1346257 RepID=A0A9P4VTS1_9PEZI|nr:hypothetical protein M501DRAFT_928681 [Patellaria atrata CBS 101060]
MAHLARLTNLADELVRSLTPSSLSKSPREFKQCKDQALKGIRSQQYARVDQFDVQAHYEGLVEKFVVLHREELATALEIRLDELSKRSSKWTPEILFLFLSLSDRPAEKSDVKDLELLKPPPSPPQLTWAEIIADDPLDEEGVWDDIDYAAQSSDDERSTKGRHRSPSLGSSPPLTPAEVGVDASPSDYIVVPETSILDGIEDAQFWREGKETPGKAAESTPHSKSTEISELQAIREILFMLAGLPTALFQYDERSGIIRYVPKFRLSHAMVDTFHQTLDSFLRIGTALWHLRLFIKQQQSIPLLQTFHAVVTRRLRDFDIRLSTISQRLMGHDKPIVVSLIQLQSEISSLSRNLLVLARLVNDFALVAETQPFLHLEALYQQSSEAQMVGDADALEFFGTLFFECLQTYLRPIRQWMEMGELIPDDKIFFISVMDRSSEASNLWHDRYSLMYGNKGRLHAPTFLQPAAEKIFKSGKSVIFLKELGNKASHNSRVDTEPPLTFESLYGSDEINLLSPFSEMFNTAFQKWMASKYSFASTILRQQLYDECGLWDMLDSLEYLYFSRDGTIFQSFADTIFEKLDGGRGVWNDRFVLTEIAQSIFSTIPSIDSGHIFVRTTTNSKGRSVKAFSSIRIDYTIPWSIANVIQKSSIAVYQQTHTLLLQTYRAKYVLRKLALRTQKSTAQSYHLRHRLLWFTDVLHSHLTENVLKPMSIDLRQKMDKAEDIDAMSSVHENFATTVQSRCLLSGNLAPIRQAVVSLLDLAVLFADTQAKETKLSASNTPVEGQHQVSPSRARHSRKLRRGQTSTEDAYSEPESEEEDYDAHSDSDIGSQGSYEEKLRRMREHFDKLRYFVTVSLRGVSRAGGETSWEMLADRLEWES